MQTSLDAYNDVFVLCQNILIFFGLLDAGTGSHNQLFNIGAFFGTFRRVHQLCSVISQVSNIVANLRADKIMSKPCPTQLCTSFVPSSSQLMLSPPLLASMTNRTMCLVSSWSPVLVSTLLVHPNSISLSGHHRWLCYN